VPLAEVMNPIKPPNSFCPLEAGGGAESSRNERDVIKLRGGEGRREAVCSLHFVWEREVPHAFPVSVSGSTMTRDEAVAQDGARNSVSNGACLGLEPK